MLIKILIYFSEVCGVREYSEPFSSTEFTNSRIIDPVKASKITSSTDALMISAFQKHSIESKRYYYSNF